MMWNLSLKSVASLVEILQKAEHKYRDEWPWSFEIEGQNLLWKMNVRAIWHGEKNEIILAEG